MCYRHGQRKDKRGKDRMKWEIEEPGCSVILCGLWLWQNYPPRRTTVAADIRFWFPGKALTSYGYMVLPQTNNVTDAYISAGMCVLQRVCVCARGCLCTRTPLQKTKPFCYWWSWGPKAQVWVIQTLTQHVHAHTHTQAIRGVGLWVPPSVGCSRSVWWRTLSHSRGSYKTVTTVIFISPSLYESLVLSLVFFLLFQGAGFAFVSGCSSGMKTHMSSEVRLSQPHTHTHTHYPLNHRPRTTCHGPLCYKCIWLPVWKCQRLPAFLSITTRLCSSCFGVEPQLELTDNGCCVWPCFHRFCFK